eukprot:496515-Pelagomonas_calceolata.AAC.4
MIIGYPPFYSDDPLTTCRKIVNWRMFLKFPDEIQVMGQKTPFGVSDLISPAAKDLICRLMCDVDDRLGSNGVEEIKVRPILQGPTVFCFLLDYSNCILHLAKRIRQPGLTPNPTHNQACLKQQGAVIAHQPCQTEADRTCLMLETTLSAWPPPYLPRVEHELDTQNFEHFDEDMNSQVSGLRCLPCVEHKRDMQKCEHTHEDMNSRASFTGRVFTAYKFGHVHHGVIEG